MTPTQVTPDNASSVAPARLVAPRMIAAADMNDVMREQLDILIEHAQNGVCGCEQCKRYLRARALLLTEIFPESAPALVLQKSAR
jgi:hypothetical protein